ncbi:MAG: lipid A biosynthesis lauroyl acyltransferase [Janthinobacterium lividum]
MNRTFPLLVGLLRVLAKLPYGVVARLGCSLGWVLYAIPSRRKRIVLVNLRLCFPAKSERERQCLARKHFQHVIRSYLERGYQWFGSAELIQQLVQIESRIDLDEVSAPPTIFMGFHFVGIEVGCMLYSLKAPVASLYTRMKNEQLCTLARTQRGRFGAEMIERATSARTVMRILRTGKPVMLATDMDQGEDGSVFVQFFGVPTCTLTAISRIATMTGARVVPFVTEVLPNYKGYKLTISEPLPNFPTASASDDARTMNHFLENQINKFPEQYYWVHRRFKHRPPGEPSVYE